MSFARLLADAAWRADGCSLCVPEDWHQGRTAYGGFSSALALAAARRLGESLSDGEAGGVAPLRSAQISFVGPLAGEIDIAARLLRAGRNALWVAAEITAKDAKGPGLVACFVFMRGVASTATVQDRPPPAGLIAPEAAHPVDMAHAPAFLKHHFEARFALPRAEKRADVTFWVRLREGDGVDPAIALLLTADALPPGVMPLLPPGVPVSSMSWQTNMLTDRPATRDGWWLLRSSADYAENGCSSQAMAVWDADGTPAMAGMQAIAIFG